MFKPSVCQHFMSEHRNKKQRKPLPWAATSEAVEPPLAAVGATARELWPEGEMATRAEYAAYIKEHVEPLQLVPCERGFALPPVAVVAAMPPAVARRAELQGDVLLDIAATEAMPVITGVNDDGHVVFGAAAVCLAPAIAASMGPERGQLGHRAIAALPPSTAEQDELRQDVATFVAHTLHFRAAQFRRLLALKDSELAEEWAERAWWGFLLHPDWLFNLRVEKALGPLLAGGGQAGLAWLVALLRARDQRRTVPGRKGKVLPGHEVLGLRTSITTRTKIPRGWLQRFPVEPAARILNASGVQRRPLALVQTSLALWSGTACCVIDGSGVCVGNYWFDDCVWHRLYS